MMCGLERGGVVRVGVKTAGAADYKSIDNMYDDSYNAAQSSRNTNDLGRAEGMTGKAREPPLNHHL